jgi:hypothetical protein
VFLFQLHAKFFLNELTFFDWSIWQQEEDRDCHGCMPGGVDELVVGLLLEEDEAEEAAAHHGNAGQEETASVLEAGVANPFC